MNAEADITKKAKRNGLMAAGNGPCGVESAGPYEPAKTLIAKGITKRELFAAMAMQGLLASSDEKCEFRNKELLIESAVAHADYLLEALEK